MKNQLGVTIAGVLTLAAWADGTSAQTVHHANVHGPVLGSPPINVKVGDTVRWTLGEGIDAVESGIDGGHDGNFNSAGTTGSLEVTFDRAFMNQNPMPGNTYPYYLITADSALVPGSVSVSGGTTHVVELHSITFVPADIEIMVGDTVRWVWVTGFHNVESGVGGVHDGNFRSGDPVFDPNEYELTFDQQFLDDHPVPDNLYPYYCIIHFGVNMSGTVTVSAGGCARNPVWLCDGDVDGDGQVNPVDSGLVQAAFGSMDEQDLCNYDMDCDGQINPVDSGIVQSLFGTCEAPRATCP
jgi:plastocyanin